MNTLSHKSIAARTLLVLLVVFTGESAMSIEKPDYEVVFKAGDVEYRQYAPYLVAETVVQGRDDYQSAGNEGFRRLFRYITGGNRSQQDIAMTSPVAQAPAGEKIAMTAPVQQTGAADGWRVAFMLPKQFTLETAPVPSDERVEVKRVPGRLMAVLRYSGRWTDKTFQKGKARLEKAIENAAVEPIGEMESALYDPPYKPPFMRRNEVMIEVSAAPVGQRAARSGNGTGVYAMILGQTAE